MTNTTIPENLKLVLEHFTAVRELDRYLHKKGVLKDLERYTKDVVVPSLVQHLPTLGSWEPDIDSDGVEWYPDNWKLDDENYATLYLIMPSPAHPDPEDSLPSVNLWVPTEWAGYNLFRENSPPWHAKLRKAGFRHIDDDTGWDDEYIFGKSIGWLKEDGSFDEDDLMERIAAATQAIVELEPAITESIKKASVQCPAKKQGQTLGKKKPA